MASPSTIFVELSFTFLEEKEGVNFQAAFFSSFAHSAPCRAEEVEPFVSFEGTLREEAFHWISKTTSKTRHLEGEQDVSTEASLTIYEARSQIGEREGEEGAEEQGGTSLNASLTITKVKAHEEGQGLLFDHSPPITKVKH